MFVKRFQLNLRPLTRRLEHDHLYFQQKLRANKTDQYLIKSNYKKNGNHKKLIVLLYIVFEAPYIRSNENEHQGFSIRGERIFRRTTTIMLRVGFNQTKIFFTQKISYIVVVLSKLVYISRITAKGSPPSFGDFCDFL